jgi:hypothetical protein
MTFDLEALETSFDLVAPRGDKLMDAIEEPVSGQLIVFRQRTSERVAGDLFVRPATRWIRAGACPRRPARAVRGCLGNAPLQMWAATGNARPRGRSHRSRRDASRFPERRARGSALPHRADSSPARRGRAAHLVRPAEGRTFACHQTRRPSPSAPDRRPIRRVPRRDPPSGCAVPGTTCRVPSTRPTRQVARVRFDLPGVHENIGARAR